MDRYLGSITANHVCHESEIRQVGQTTYHLNLSVYFKKDGFQELCVMGELPELGKWKETKVWMKWTKGDIWVIEQPIITTKQYFTFKFAIADRSQNKLIQFERGVDRICDLELLPEQKSLESQLSQDSHNHSLSHSNTHSHTPITKYCSLDNLEWESFYVSFSLSYPIQNTDESIILTGNRQEVKNQKLEKVPRPIDWMHSKYGGQTQPWELTIKMPNIEGGVDGVWAEDAKHRDFTYKYGLQKLFSNQTIWERDPSRQMVLQNAGSYQGQLGLRRNRFWFNTDIVYIVNGRVDMADGNFIGPFHIDKIGETGLFIGSYPFNGQDYDKIRDKQVTAVLDIQTKQDRRSLKIDLAQQKHYYSQRGIETVNCYEVSDEVEAEYCHSLFEAAKILNDLVNNQGHKVFVNCSTGVSRAPTLVIVYIALFIQHQSWEDIEQIYQFQETCYPWQDPNVSVAQIVIDTKREFQQNNLQMKLDKERAAAEVDQRNQKHSGIAEEIERVKKAIKDLENQILMNQNTHLQRMAKDKENKSKDSGSLKAVQERLQQEIELQKELNLKGKQGREQKLKDKQSKNDEEYQKLKQRNLEEQKQRGGGSYSGDNSRVQELKLEIEQGSLKGKDTMSDLHKTYEIKLQEVRMQEQEKEAAQKKQKLQSQDQKMSELQQEYLDIQVALQNATPLYQEYRSERVSFEKKIEQLTLQKTEDEEKERLFIIEMTQKESEWNLTLLREQDTYNSRKISIMHVKSQLEIQEQEMESEKRRQQIELETKSRLRMQEMEFQRSYKQKHAEFEKMRQFQESEASLQQQQFDDHRAQIDLLEIELQRKIKYEHELKFKELNDQEHQLKKKWYEELALKQKAYATEEEKRRKHFQDQYEDCQDKQQEEIDQWREYHARMDAEREEMRRQEEEEWMHQMQDEKNQRAEARLERQREAENKRKLAMEEAAKKKAQAPQRFQIKQEWDDEEIARMEAAKKIRMVEIARKKQEYLDSLNTCHSNHDNGLMQSNSVRLSESIHRQRSIEADKLRRAETNRRSQELKDKSLRRRQQESDIEARRMSLRKASISKLYKQETQTHTTNEVGKLREQNSQPRFNQMKMPVTPKEQGPTIDFENRYIRQTPQPSSEMFSFQNKERLSRHLAPSRQTPLQQPQQTSQTRSLLKPPTPVGKASVLNNDLFSSQKKSIEGPKPPKHLLLEKTPKPELISQSEYQEQELLETPSESQEPPAEEDFLQEEEINRLCADLFTTAPIKFRARRNNEIDILIKAIIEAKGITIPIIWIKDDLYLIGHQRMNCSIKRSCLMLRVGGGYEPFQEYLVYNQGYFMRMLIVHIIKSQNSLEEVIQILLSGKKIRNVFQEAQQTRQQKSKFKQISIPHQGVSRQVLDLTKSRSRHSTIDQLNTAQDIRDINYFEVNQESFGDITVRQEPKFAQSIEFPSSPLKQRTPRSLDFQNDLKPKPAKDDNIDTLQLQEQLQNLQNKYESLNQLFSQSQAIVENREQLKSIEHNLKSFLEREQQSLEKPDLREKPSKDVQKVIKMSVISQQEFVEESHHRKSVSNIEENTVKIENSLKQRRRKNERKFDSEDLSKSRKESVVKSISESENRISSKNKDKKKKSSNRRSRDSKSPKLERKETKKSKKSKKTDVSKDKKKKSKSNKKEKEKEKKDKDKKMKKKEKSNKRKSRDSSDCSIDQEHYHVKSSSSSSSDKKIMIIKKESSSSSSDKHHHHDKKSSSSSSSSSDKKSHAHSRHSKNLSVVLENSDILQPESIAEQKELRMNASPLPEQPPKQISYVSMSSPQRRNSLNLIQQEKSTSPSKSPMNRQKSFAVFLKYYKATFKRPLDDLWAEFDSDNDGQLDKEQTNKFMEQVCLVIQGDRAKNYDSSKFDELYQTFDEDNNGLMSKAEMSQFIKIAFKNTK